MYKHPKLFIARLIGAIFLIIIFLFYKFTSYTLSLLGHTLIATLVALPLFRAKNFKQLKASLKVMGSIYLLGGVGFVVTFFPFFSENKTITVLIFSIIAIIFVYYLFVLNPQVFENMTSGSSNNSKLYKDKGWKTFNKKTNKIIFLILASTFIIIFIIQLIFEYFL